MDDANEETFIVPALADDNAGTTQYCNLAVLRPTGEKENNLPVDENGKISTKSSLILRVNSDDSFPTRLGNSDCPDFKDDDASIDIRAYEALDRTVDGDDNRSRVYGAYSPPSARTNVEEQSSRTTKIRILISCLFILVSATVTLAWQLNESTKLNLRLQAELNQTTGLLEDYRAHQRWVMDSRAMNEGTRYFEVETCWIEASITLGPCANNPFEDVKDAYRKTYEGLSSLADKAHKWWTVSTDDSGSAISQSDLPVEIVWSEQNAIEAPVQTSPSSTESQYTTTTTSHQCHLWSEIKSWFGGGSKSASIGENRTRDEDDGSNYGRDYFIGGLQNNTILRNIRLLYEQQSI